MSNTMAFHSAKIILIPIHFNALSVTHTIIQLQASFLARRNILHVGLVSSVMLLSCLSHRLLAYYRAGMNLCKLFAVHTTCRQATASV